MKASAWVVDVVTEKRKDVYKDVLTASDNREEKSMKSLQLLSWVDRLWKLIWSSGIKSGSELEVWSGLIYWDIPQKDKQKSIFRAVEWFPMMDKCHYTFVKTHRMYDTKSEP